MDMLYLTGQRIGDVLKIKHSDITSEGIFFQQQKTGTKLMVAMSPDLERTIKAAKELHYCVRGITLFHTHKGSRLPIGQLGRFGKEQRSCKDRKREHSRHTRKDRNRCKTGRIGQHETIGPQDGNQPQSLLERKGNPSG